MVAPHEGNPVNISSTDQVPDPRGCGRDQRQSNCCKAVFFFTACTTKKRIDKVQTMELHEDSPTIDDISQTPEDKAVEELKRIYIDQHDEKYFVIGTSLPKASEQSLIELLI